MIRKQNIPGLLVGVLATMLLLNLRVSDPNALATLRGAGFDTLQRIWPRTDAAAQPVRIVDIDEASLRQLGQWPWPRTQLAKLVDNLSELGAAAITFDIIFPEPDRMSPDHILNDPLLKQAVGTLPTETLANLPNNDAILAKAITGRSVVLAFAGGTGAMAEPPMAKAGFAQTGLPAFDVVPPVGKITRNLKILDDAAIGLGDINIDFSGEQGIARHIPLLWSDGKSYYPSLVLESLRVAQGASTIVVNGSPDTENALDSIRVGEIEIPVADNGQLSIYYSHNRPNLYVSAARVISADDHQTLRPLIQGHIILIGTSAVGLLDSKTSSLGEAIPGVSVHAQALQQIMSGAFLKRPEWAAASEYVFVGMIGLLISLGMIVFRPLPVVASLFANIAFLAFITAYAFRSFGVLIDVTFPILAIATIFLTTIAFKLLVTDREGRELRNVFSHYVAPSILAEIESNPRSLKLGGETRDITVMFVDIQNFTPMGESLEPEVLVGIVNNLLSACCAGILSKGGTIDKFIGDAVMAFWNAPIAQNDHQYLASLAALEIQNKIKYFNSNEANQAILKPHGLWPISVRIGLATGPAIVGNMGSLERFDYSVLGETVNLASRAEGMCKQVGHNIIIAGSITNKTNSMAIIDAGSVLARGKTQKTPIHLVLGDEVTKQTPEFQTFAAHYDTIIKDIRSRKPNRAIKSLIILAKAQNPFHSNFLDKIESRVADYEKIEVRPSPDRQSAG